MELVAFLDLVSTAAFAAAAGNVLRAGAGARSPERTERRLLATAFAIYFVVGISNVLQHSGVTEYFDAYEDYLEILYLPLLLMFVYASVNSREIRLREASEVRYRTLVEGMDFGVSLIDADHRVLMTNSAQGRLYGRRPEEFVGRRCFREFEGRDGVCPHCPGVLSMADRRMHEQETEIRRPDGGAFPVRIRSFPTFGANGAVTGFMELVEDITEERRAGEEHRRLEEQIRQTQKLESLGVLAGGIAHDFNNILSGIMGNTELALLSAADRERTAGHMSQVRTLAERAAELVNQLLAYAGRGSFSIRPLDLNGAIREMLQLLRVSVSKKARLETDLEPGLPAVPADAVQVRQVLMNLVINASEAIGDREGKILVKTAAVDADQAYLDRAFPGWPVGPGRYVSLEVSDTGCGMGTDIRSRLFDPFFTTKFTGRGLGLSAVLGIVKGHQGAIRVYSEEAQGTRFQVLLPARRAEQTAQPAAAPAPETGVWRGSGTVLVADDEQQVRDVTAQLLEVLGYGVLTAADGAECVELFKARGTEVGLVLLDMTMPRLDGREVLRELRRLSPGIRVLMMSGFSPEETAARLEGVPQEQILQKPFTITRLKEALASLPPAP